MCSRLRGSVRSQPARLLGVLPSKSAPRSLSGLSNIFKATPAKAAAAPLRDEINSGARVPSLTLRVIAEGRFAAGGDGAPSAAAPWPGAADRASPRAGVTDVVVGWAAKKRHCLPPSGATTSAPAGPCESPLTGMNGSG
jgi:hypothetical protein